MNTTNRIGDMVAELPSAAKVFHRYRMDFCCGGSQTLEFACSEQGLDPKAIIAEIEREGSKGNSNVLWSDQPLDTLIDHIIGTFHVPIKEELPRLLELAQKVEAAHAEKPDVPKGLAHHISNIHEEVNEHLIKEEQILFPLIRNSKGSNANMSIKVLVQDHEDLGKNLGITREVTNKFDLPDHACATWRELYLSLEQLEKDMMEHIHLENNILFPRALGQ